MSDRSPLALLIDAIVFAPVGAALLAREHLPKLAEQGRTHLENRVRVARMVGEFAVKAGKKEVERRLASRPQPTGGPAQSSEQSSATGSATPADSAASEPSPVPASAQTAAAAQGADSLTLVADRPAVDDLAIPGYDSLAASQVVDRLASLSAEELELVRRYESGGRHRRTILHRIEQLVG